MDYSHLYSAKAQGQESSIHCLSSLWLAYKVSKFLLVGIFIKLPGLFDGYYEFKFVIYTFHVGGDVDHGCTQAFM